jgi:MerR family transcriptional regulator, light-induced transcriptional regulator
MVSTMGPFLTSNELARVLGVSVATVRRWADAGLLPGERTAGGHRRFSLELAERLARQRGGDDTSQDGWIALLVGPGAALEVDAALLTERSRRGSWLAVAVALSSVLEALGRRWQAGQLTVVEEHVASARLARALARVADGFPVDPTAPRVLLATAEGESHTLGLSLVELLLREQGWSAIWIGRETPSEQLARRVEVGGVEVLAVSASCVRSAAELAACVALLGPACAAAQIELLVGGGGPWPEPLPGGQVVRDFGALKGWMAARRGQGAPAN